jgi:hypothetical protein
MSVENIIFEIGDISRADCLKVGQAVQVGGVWIIWNGREPCGPYDTKTEAESDRKGMERFYRLADKPGYMTIEKGK